MHKWVRFAFVAWAVISMTWLANTMRTRGVPDSMMRSSAAISVVESDATLEFLPTRSAQRPSLIFICGSGVAARAYAPLLRPIAEAGYPVVVIRLPYRFAPLDSHKNVAIDRVHTVIETHPEVPRWVVAGHSLGAALACRVVERDPSHIAAMVLIGTTHPKERDLSALSMPVTKVFASNDGVAPPDRVLANKGLLPAHTKWIEIRGGNHSQFANYGRQLFDGKATISREAQQSVARSALLEALRGERQ